MTISRAARLGGAGDTKTSQSAHEGGAALEKVGGKKEAGAAPSCRIFSMSPIPEDIEGKRSPTDEGDEENISVV